MITGLINPLLSDAADVFVRCDAARGFMAESKLELCFSSPLVAPGELTCFLPPTGTTNQSLILRWVERSRFDSLQSSQNCVFKEKIKTLYCRDQTYPLDELVYLIAMHAIRFFTPYYDQRTQLINSASKGLISLPEYEEIAVYSEYLGDISVESLDTHCQKDWKDSFTISNFLNPFNLLSHAHLFLKYQVDGRMDRIRAEWMNYAYSSYCSKNPGADYSCYSFSKADLLREKNQVEKIEDIAHWLYEFKNNQIPYSKNFTQKISQLWEENEGNSKWIKELNRVGDKLAAKGELGYDITGIIEEEITE